MPIINLGSKAGRLIDKLRWDIDDLKAEIRIREEKIKELEKIQWDDCKPKEQEEDDD